MLSTPYKSTLKYDEHTVSDVANKKPDTILQCTLVYIEYTVQSISVFQIYTYSRVHHPDITVHENILSTL